MVHFIENLLNLYGQTNCKHFLLFSQHCSEDSAPCPSVFMERLAFEMDKKYLETKLQVLVSPAILVVRDMEAVNTLLVLFCYQRTKLVMKYKMFLFIPCAK